MPTRSNVKKVRSTKHKATAKKTQQRKVSQPEYKSFRLQKKLKHPAKPLPKARHLLARAVRLVLKNKGLYIKLLLVYLLIFVFLVKGVDYLLSGETAQIKESVAEILETDESLYSSIALLGVALGTSSSTGSDTGSIYFTILTLVMTVCVIWSLRHLHARKRHTVKDMFYNGVYPIIPFSLVVLIISVQILPLVIGSTIFSIISSSGLITTGLERMLWVLFVIFTALLTFYMLLSSLFALIVVTLPNTKPLEALRSARALVLHRRLEVARKVLFLPVVLLLLFVLILLPVIMIVPIITELVLVLLIASAYLVALAYLYELYREML